MMKSSSSLFALALSIAPLAASAAGAGAAPPPMPAGARFVISVDGRDIGPFQQLVSMGAAKPPSLTLKRGIGADVSIQAWREQALVNDPLARKSADLRAIGPSGATVATWRLRACWPSALAAAGPKPGSSQIAIASVRLTCASIQKTS